MNIKKKLNINVIASIMLISILLGMQILEFNFINKEIERIKLAAEVRTAVFELNSIISDYAIYEASGRVKEQWYLRYNSGLAVLQKAEEEEKGERERELIMSITKDYDALGGLFPQVTQNQEDKERLIQEGAPAEEIAAIEAVEDGILAQVRATSQSILSSTNALQEVAFESGEKVLGANRNLNFLLGTILLVIITAISFKVSRQITRPIEQLIEANREIAKGNFRKRVHLMTDDEFQELGSQFNKTAKVLEEVENKEINEAKTKLILVTSHELRSPLTPMKAQLQMLEKEYFGKLNKKQKGSLSVVLANAERLDKIILDFLEVSRLETGILKFQFKDANINEVVYKTVESMRGYIPEKKVRVKLSLGKLPIIKADPDRLAQVLRNLMGNAIKFSKNGGRVDISTKKQKDSIILGVKDYGPGISHESQSQLFKPFFQADPVTSRRYGGTGLGLAICRGIVLAQNGKIWVESALGKGSTFYFTVPLIPVEEPKRITILVEDVEKIQKRLRELFSAEWGAAGIRQFEELKGKGELTEKNLSLYIDSLVKEKALEKDRASKIKNTIADIFA